MRVVVAPDCFTGTLSAPEAAAAIARGWARSAPGDDLDLAPLSDGGPGFVATLHAALGGDLVERAVTGPHGRPVTAHVLRTGDTAYVESAQACGLHLLAPAERRPTATTTQGVGELLAGLADVPSVVVGLGGSGTSDGGAGALAALGLGLLGRDGAPLAPGGAALRHLDRVVVPAGWPPLAGVELVAATDVDNPLLGPTGASAVYAPQKGATPADVAALDAALAAYADRLAAALPDSRALRDRPGAGAAGGLGFALFVLGAGRASGVGVVADAIGLVERVAAADLVVTGEGRFDQQSLRGKAVGGVAALAREAGVPCLVLAGQVAVRRREQPSAVVGGAYALVEQAGSLAGALADPAGRLSDLAARVAREWSQG